MTNVTTAGTAHRPNPDGLQLPDPALTLAGIATIGVVGIVLDMAWHGSVSQQGPWTPPHIVLYLTGALTAWLATPRPAGAKRLSTMGVAKQGPGGGTSLALRFVRSGGLVMLLAMPAFWWDGVRSSGSLVTPPHILTLLGMLGVLLGLLHLALTSHHRPTTRHGVFTGHLGGMLILTLSLAATEYVGYPNLWHGVEFYQIAGAIFPAPLVILAAASRSKWVASLSATAYAILTLLLIWALPALPTPSLEAPPARLLAPQFPLLLIAPAVLIDLVIERTGPPERWLHALGLAGFVGILVVITMISVHWPLADFLLSPEARSAIFSADRWPNGTPLGSWRYQYWTLSPWTTEFVRGMAGATLAASASTLVGLRIGRRLSA